jgi:DnaK suppressor protein
MENFKNRKLTKKQFSCLQEELEGQKKSLSINDLFDSNDFKIQSEETSDTVDHATADTNNAQRLRFRNREVFYLKKINEALRKMQKKEYGTCTECAVDIGYERLIARPTAELCIGCKEEAERGESKNYIARQSKSLGRPVDLVRNI